MNPDVARGTLGACLALGKALADPPGGRPTIGYSKGKVANFLSTVQWLDSRSRADIASICESIAREYVARWGLARETPSTFPLASAFVSFHAQDVMKAFNRANRRRWVRTRGNDVANQLRLGMAREDPVVFFLVSSHQKPQKAHRGWQGKVLVNCHWRQAFADDPDRARTVSFLIRNRSIQSVQRAIGAPDYLLLRPNCRHRLIPLRTEEVLTSSARALSIRHNPRPTNVKRPIGDKERYRQCKALRTAISERLGRFEARLQGKRKEGL